MKFPRPGILAVRAINDYRRRDIFGYLGLRYYLENSAAKTDEWARRAAVNLVVTRTVPGYFNAEHFKEVSDTGHIEHRSMFIPGPNESLAEAALLAECAKHPTVFGNPPCVHSYALNDHNSRRGTFLPYTSGLRTRQTEITRACEAFPSGIVQYTDIKKFYPSVDVNLASAAWAKHCDAAKLAGPFRELGEKLLYDYGAASLHGRRALLTGPMFSHLLANLIFRQLDDEFSSQLPAKYLRYVDDITLVGTSRDVVSSIKIVREKVESLGLNLHPDGSPKNLEVPCSAWLVSRNDFTNEGGNVSWMRLIGNLKQFLTLPGPAHTKSWRPKGFPAFPFHSIHKFDDS